MALSGFSKLTGGMAVCLLLYSPLSMTQNAADWQEDVELQPATPGVNFSGTGLVMGELLNGELHDQYPQMGDGTFADCFQFEATEGQSYRFTLRSDEFDSYLLIGVGFCQDVLLQHENDDFEQGSGDSRIELTAEYPFYAVYVNTFEPGAVGAYTLLVEQASD
ncbi:hypothetical protein [Pseudohongiella spirulinae]|uniref:Peptidase C-terminal archaeal/bacterial domain-containing protein n=1 Tax=Pseudohongiella spirulinae TaxID=1249552 RepID=A0A0S2KAN5_9GAMM|nr:hypothetical protein [Pseudohongiella spirulinae]ALO45354.1 hypothetical protein PS2015_674 [Pseudohongiella spirulinae]